uniref:[acyl-carrier-protein] S-malonyltransferase n=1 Tax=Caenorhabditis japonica TaxID=281687 RepID=A0A8R1IN38_CAEJA
MSECAKLVNSGMVTVRVKAASKLDKAMADARKAAIEKRELDICEVANYLYCGVRVIGGSETCLQFLEKNQEKYNIQVLKRLAVSAAFHTRQMESAVAKAFTNVEMQRAVCNVYSNYTGQVLPTKRSDIRGAVAKQVNSPVKWEQIQQVLFRKHQDEKFPRFYEVGPGRQLGAMLLQTSKKAHKSYTHFSC